MDGTFLGFDVGTQGTKGIALDPARGVIARAAVGYGLLPGLPPGAAEQHPDTWIDAVREVAAVLLREVGSSSVHGVGVSGQQHGCVPLDAAGAVLRPAKLWCDTSTSDQARRLSAQLGRSVPTGFTASKILWLKEREPDSFARLRHVLLPHDYVDWRLTGAMTMEPGDASGTGFFDVVRGAFDEGAMAAIDPHLAGMLPALRAPGELAGRVDAAGAAWSGIPEGTPVSTGGGDNMLSAVGSGAVREGVVVLSLGTSGTVFTHAEQAHVDPRGWIASFRGSCGGHLPLLCVMNCTGVTEEVRSATGLSHERLTALAEKVAPGCEGLLWLPFLAGERVPDLPEATGTLLGLRGGGLSPGRLYRAAIEGTSCNLALGIERMRSLGIAVAELRVVGGASRNPLWLAVLADLCGVPVRRLVEAESAALGAALQALWAVRRLAEPGLPIGEVVAPFVQLDAAVIDPGPAAAEYRELRVKFAAAVRERHGVDVRG